MYELSGLHEVSKSSLANDINTKKAKSSTNINSWSGCGFLVRL